MASLHLVGNGGSGGKSGGGPHDPPDTLYGVDARQILLEVKNRLRPFRLKSWEVDDIAQQVLLRVVARARGTPVDDPIAFAKECAFNACLDAFRSSKSDKKKLNALAAEMTDTQSKDRPDQPALLHEFRERIDELLERLDDAELRQILVLCFLSGRSLEDVRKSMRLERTPVRGIVTKLMAILKKHFGVKD